MQNDKLIHHLKEVLELLNEEITASVATAVVTALKEVQNSSLDRSNDEPYLTIDEAASIFKISRSQIYNLRNQHKDFPFIRIGESVRYKQSELEAFFKKS